MSSFTVGLAIIGGLLLAILVGWNTWMTRRSIPRQAQTAPGSAPLPIGERQDPVFDPSIVPPLPVLGSNKIGRAHV